MTLSSIRSCDHLVTWCGLGPAPDISWACQLDQSAPQLGPVPPQSCMLPLLMGMQTARPRPHPQEPGWSCPTTWAPCPESQGSAGSKSGNGHIWGLSLVSVSQTICPMPGMHGSHFCRHKWCWPCHPSWSEMLYESSALNERHTTLL